MKAQREGPEDGDGELSIEVELEWPENATDTDLSIEYAVLSSIGHQSDRRKTVSVRSVAAK